MITLSDHGVNLNRLRLATLRCRVPASASADQSFGSFIR